MPKEGSGYKIINGTIKARAQAVWFTNLEIDKRYEDLILYKKYSEEEYLHYDNYDAINVNKTKDIPLDFNGKMGVPITFLNVYNPKQFEIIGSDHDVKKGLFPKLIKSNWNGKVDRAYLKGKRLYARLLIKKKN